MLNGVDLLHMCIDHPEPYVEEAYEKEYFLITESPDRLNELMKANREILDRITAFRICREQDNDIACEKILAELIPLLETKDINNSEFTSYWGVIDVSYSMFKKMNRAKKINFLRQIIPRYLTKRHAIYAVHGYTATTLQVKADSFAHKRSGPLGRRKVLAMFDERDIEPIDLCDPAGIDGKQFYLLPDGGHFAQFEMLLKKRGIAFKWSTRHKGKLPDFAVVYEDIVLIVEHKHMKEFGGGQDKQIIELSEFVNQPDEPGDVSYVAFMDGPLFNKIFTTSVSSRKVREQRRQIEASLAECPCNYFVNTFGFAQLLDELC